MLCDNPRPRYDGGLRRGAALLAAVLATVLAGCGTGTAATPRATPAPTGATTGAPTLAGTPAPIDPLSGCAPTVRFSVLSVIARLQNADDVAVAPDGSIWVSDASSQLEHLSSAGALLQRIADPRAPEGIVVRADGSLLVAEQRPDRIVVVQPSQPMVLRTVAQLNLPGGATGVDGIGYDASIDAVLVPDSPNGTLLEKPVTGGETTQLASGLGRPVGVAMVEDGSFAVTAENPAGLVHIPARGGAAIPVPGVSDADDVVISGMLAYVTSLGTHQLLAVDLTTLRMRVLVTSIDSPQGLAQLPDGKLVLTDSTTGTIAIVQGCG